MNESCFICNKHNGKVNTSGITIYEDEYVLVGHIDKKGKQNYLGHIMVDLKRHVPSLAEMTIQEAKAFGIVMAKVSKGLKETKNAKHVYALVSGNSNSVPHLHLHLVARYPNTPEEFWGPMEVYDWAEAPMGGNDEVIEICRRIKTFLQNEAQIELS